jgi:Ni/Fe-hydrogenase 1 B-type cytochrome subunit
MEKENIRYVRVWSGWLRLCHWVIAFGVLFQILSAWAADHDFVDPAFWHDWHIIVGQIVFVALIVRIILLFTQGSSHWRSLIPKKTQFDRIQQMIKFYLSLARSPLPNWYAHNPFWQPIYLLFLIVLLGSTISGFLNKSTYFLAGFSMDSIHAALAAAIVIFTIGHIVPAFLHDLKGKGAFISAIINGYRYFHVSNEISTKPGMQKSDSDVVIPIKKIIKKADR